ncbi:MAG TPA: hypothetical protein DCQ50_14670 [Chryseobacterium sp.]|nr:hypothetical protein [Chryseobacterium sp.]
MAEKWKDFGRNVDLYPNIKLTSVQDGRVRPEHRVLDGTIRPYNDPFWNTHTPPLDWGCRCDIEQTDEEPTKIQGDLQLKIEFENNPGKSGKIFEGTAYAEGLSETEKKEAENEAQRIYERSVLSKPRKQQFKELAKYGNGSVSEHILAPKQKDYESILQTATELAKEGQKAEILPIINRKDFKEYRKTVFPEYELDKNPDLRAGKLYYDIKEVESLNNCMKNANRAAKQDAIAVIRYDGKDLTEEKMQQQAKRIFGKNNIDQSGNHNYPKDIFYFLKNGKLHKYNRD